jgi:hypothetical protein
MKINQLHTLGAPMTDQEQELIDLLWKDDTPQTATKVADQCSTQQELDHTLLIAVALQRTAAVNAVLSAGASDLAREAALSLICRGLVMAGESVDDEVQTENGSWTVRAITSPVPNKISSFWSEAECAMGHYLEQYGEEGYWVDVVPALLESVTSERLEKLIETLEQATSEAITDVAQMMRSSIEWHILNAV